ncbi:MAG: hypothetical protein V4772_08660 [Pseudomonadota bacterium]
MPDWYEHGGYPSTGAPGVSVSQRQEWASVSDSFAKLPALTGTGGKAWRTKEDETRAESFDAADLATSNVFAGNQSSLPVSLTSSTTIATNAALSNNFKVTLAHNTTFANPTNMTDGMVLNYKIKQDATGNRTAVFGSKWNFGAAGVPLLGTTAGSIDFISAYYDADDDVLLASFRGS